jgi:Ca-activated chloride channel homolog
MTFLSPAALWLLLGVAALAVAYVALQVRRRHYAVRFTNLDLLDTVAPRRPGWRRHVTAGAAGVALSALVVALARPARDEEVPTESAVVVLAVDVSASMDATDVDPDRLTAAVDAATEFVEGLPDTIEVGLVAFAGTARIAAEPTTDHDAVVAAIQQLQTAPGTAAGDGLLAALDAIAVAQAEDGIVLARSAQDTTDAVDDAPSATIVVLSDGATTAGTPIEDATAAAVAAGVPVSTITYGTDAGTVEVEGQVVPVPPDTATMQAVADATGGTAFVAATGEELQTVYEQIQARVGTETVQHEIGRTFLFVALAALALSLTGALLWTGRFL